MKAVILAAGHTRTKCGFPPDSKPKTLFHVNGKTLLERIVTPLRKAGVKDIRIVVGYKKEQIIAFNKKRKLGLEIVHNPKWNVDAVTSLQIGMKGIKDDVLIVYCDVNIDAALVKAFMNCHKPFVGVQRDPRETVTPKYFALSGIVKIRRDMIKCFDDPWRAFKKHSIAILGWQIARTFRHILAPHLGNYEMLHILKWDKIVKDVDFYRQTDERERAQTDEGRK